MATLEEYLSQPSGIYTDLRKLFKNGPEVIFEIGACESEDTIKYSRQFPGSVIYAFEPLPGNFEIASGNLKKYKISNALLFPVALSDKSGETDFFVSSGRPSDKPADEDWDYGNKSSSILPPGDYLKETTPFLNFDSVIKVPTKRLDEFCLERGITSIDYIHMDVQGAELLVLEGAGKMIENIKVIWLEVAKIELYKNQPLESDIRNFFKQNGFYLYIDSTNSKVGDQLYINSRFYKDTFPLIRKLRNFISKFRNIRILKKAGLT